MYKEEIVFNYKEGDKFERKKISPCLWIKTIKQNKTK